jgi:LuxR family transcriptional regulator, maltose regulon positive regulatory protein
MDSESFVHESVFMAARAASLWGHEKASRSSKRMRRSSAPAKQIESTIKISTLGYFAIRRGADTPISIRTNTRPGALLQLLIAVGPRGIDKHQAEDFLWPPSAGHSARGLIDSSLYRLRQLLDLQTACRTDLGIISLDPNIVTIDAWVFEREADGLLTRLRYEGNLDAGEISVRCQRLIEIYRGPFLATQTSTPWIARTRDHLEAKFTRVIDEVGQFWQGAGRWDRAIQLYEQGLESDNLAEETYRQIIRCHLAQKHFAEAIRAYNRCQELLAMVLSVTPSAETTALYQHALRGDIGDVEP